MRDANRGRGTVTVTEPGRSTHSDLSRGLDARAAQDLIADVLEPRSDRLAHSRGVGRKGESVAAALVPDQYNLLAGAAYLHDIGYGEKAQDTGLHQIDGARYLRALGAPSDLCRLVAHHSFATVEAGARGLADALIDEFPHPTGDLERLLGLLTYCDLTTSPQGVPISVDQRFADIFRRYPEDHIVTRSMRSVELPAKRLIATISEELSARESNSLAL